MTATNSDGIEIIDISDPPCPLHVGIMADDAEKVLAQTYGVAIATIGDSTYAVSYTNQTHPKTDLD